MDPMTLAAIGMGVQAGGKILEGFFGAKQKKNEAAVAKYNAAVMRKQAEAIRIRTKFQQARAAEESARVEGELRASIGGSGIVSTQGAPLLALALQKSEADLQNYLIGYEGRMEAEQAENKALEFDMQKQFSRIGARQAMIGGFLGAGGSIAQGLSQMSPQQKQISYSSPAAKAASTGASAYGGTGGGGPTGGYSRSML